MTAQELLLDELDPFQELCIRICGRDENLSYANIQQLFPGKAGIEPINAQTLYNARNSGLLKPNNPLSKQALFSWKAVKYFGLMTNRWAEIEKPKVGRPRRVAA